MKKEYAVLKDKYGLPEYDDLNRDFKIYSVSEEDDIVHEVLKKMINVVDFYINFLEDIIQPDSRFYTLKEANVLGTSERLIVNNAYSKLLYLNRRSIELHLQYAEVDAAKFIKNLFVEWQVIKKDLLPVVTLLKDSWLKKSEIKLDEGYFG